MKKFIMINRRLEYQEGYTLHLVPLVQVAMFDGARNPNFDN